MSYNKRIKWKDHVVARPRTYTEAENADGSKTFTPANGEIIQQGTPQSATNFNKMEGGLQDVSIAFDLLATVNQAEARRKNSENTAGGAVSQVYMVTVPASRWVKNEENSWSQISGENMIALDGIKVTDNAEIALQSTRVFSEDREAIKNAFDLIDSAYTVDGGIELYAVDKPEVDIPIKILAIKR